MDKTYTQETIVAKNITLSFEFERYLQENPRLLAQILEDAEVVLLPKDDPELYRINLETARKAQPVGAQNLVYVEIELFQRADGIDIGYGNYTKEREALFADLTLDDIVAEIKRKKANSTEVL